MFTSLQVLQCGVSALVPAQGGYCDLCHTPQLKLRGGGENHYGLVPIPHVSGMGMRSLHINFPIYTSFWQALSHFEAAEKGTLFVYYELYVVDYV